MVPKVPMTIVYLIEAYVISESLVMQVRQDGALVPILEAGNDVILRYANL